MRTIIEIQPGPGGSPRGVRAISGFKKLPTSNGGVLVNEAVGLAAGKAVA